MKPAAHFDRAAAVASKLGLTEFPNDKREAFIAAMGRLLSTSLKDKARVGGSSQTATAKLTEAAKASGIDEDALTVLRATWALVATCHNGGVAL